MKRLVLILLLAGCGGSSHRAEPESATADSALAASASSMRR